MIEKLKTLEDDEIDMSVGAVNTRFADTELVRKINELVDIVNVLVKENNFHEKQIDALQMDLKQLKDAFIVRLDDIAKNNADDEFLFIACRDIAEIAERRGWLKCRKLTQTKTPWKCRILGHRWVDEPSADITYKNLLWHQYKCTRCGRYKGKWLPL